MGEKLSLRRRKSVLTAATLRGFPWQTNTISKAAKSASSPTPPVSTSYSQPISSRRFVKAVTFMVSPFSSKASL